MSTIVLLILIGVGAILLLVFYLHRTTSEINKRHLTYNDPSFPDIKKLLNVINSIQDGLIIFDRKLNPIYVNDKASFYLELPNEPKINDLIIKFQSILDLEKRLNESMQNQKPLTYHGMTIGAYTFDVSISPYTDDAHHPDRTGITLLLQDVTYEKNVEKLRDDFQHMIVHELRAPIAAIKDASSMIMKQQLQPELEKKMLTLINEQSHKLLVQVGSILDSAKLEEGKLKLNKRPSDIRKVIQEEVDLFTAEAGRKNVALTVTYAQSIPPLVVIDPIRVAQILSNLISNALKYTDKGTISVSADTDESYRNGQTGNILIKVSDTGSGIPDNIKANLFKKFSDVGTQKKDTARISSGLGLYITKGIIESHGGQIQVDSVLNQGTTFKVILPIEIAEAPVVESSPAERTAEPDDATGASKLKTDINNLPPHPVLSS